MSTPLSLISKYEDYFHNGTIHDIDHTMNSIILSLESAQLQSEWNIDNIQLSKNKTISGRLHIEEVKAIRVNNKVFDDFLKKHTIVAIYMILAFKETK